MEEKLVIIDAFFTISPGKVHDEMSDGATKSVNKHRVYTIS